MALIDEQMYLSGDEDTGVGIHCRVCDTGGAPIAYYLGNDQSAYSGTEVEVVTTITALVRAGSRHGVTHTQ